MTDSATSREMRRKITRELGRKPRVLLLSETEGTLGHARIASVLAQRIREAGGKVVVASGDIDEETFDFGGSLRKLPLVVHQFESGEVKEVTPTGSLYKDDPAYQTKRQQALLEIVRHFKPDVVAVEFHPFSWKNFRVPDIEALREYRDEVGGRLPFVTITRDDTSTRMHDQLEDALEDFDHILVKGWKEMEWENEQSQPEKITEKMEYVGHVLADVPANDNLPAEERPVMVFSSGGYHVEDKLFFDKAMEACASGVFADRPWKFVVSEKCPDDVFDALRKKAEKLGQGRVSVVHVYNSRDFSSDIANCEAAVVRGSYDVTLELLTQHKPFVVVPRSVPGFSRENMGRARFFAQNDLAASITEEELREENGADKLAAKMREATQLQPVREFTLGNGSQFAGRLLQIAMQGRQLPAKERECWADKSAARPNGHASGRG